MRAGAKSRELSTNYTNVHELQDQDMKLEERESAECRELRRRIQAVRVKRLGWSEYVLHFVMEGLGYGRSLKELNREQLEELWGKIKDYRKHGRPAEFNYDRQGRYMHALSKRAGWGEETLRAFMLIHFQKTHWNLLSGPERERVITTLQEAIELNKGE